VIAGDDHLHLLENHFAFHSMEDDQEQQQAAAAVDKPQTPLQSKKLQKLQKAHERRGIIYVSRIPPHMVRKSFG